MSTDPKAGSREEWTDSVRDPDGTRSALVSMADLVGKKWYPIILYRLANQGPMGFSDLKVSIDGISSKMLSESLRALEESHGVVARRIVEEQPLRVEYSLTDRGRSLAPIVEDLERWGRDNLAPGDSPGPPR